MTLLLVLGIIASTCLIAMSIFYSKKGEYAINVVKAPYGDNNMRIILHKEFNFQYLVPFFLYKIRETLKDCRYIGSTSLDIILGDNLLFQFNLKVKSDDEIIEQVKKWLVMELRITTINEI